MWITKEIHYLLFRKVTLFFKSILPNFQDWTDFTCNNRNQDKIDGSNLSLCSGLNPLEESREYSLRLVNWFCIYNRMKTFCAFLLLLLWNCVAYILRTRLSIKGYFPSEYFITCIPRHLRYWNVFLSVRKYHKATILYFTLSNIGMKCCSSSSGDKTLKGIL